MSSAVAITLRGDVVSNMHDVAVRVGHDPPSATVDPAAINALCAMRAGQFGTYKGQVITLLCATPVSGEFLTIQIRCPK